MKRALILFGLILVMAGAAWGRSTYLTTFNAKYGTSGTRLDDCRLCHVSGSKDRNVYGQAFEAALAAKNATVQSALTAIEGQDADSDGATNILEITARTMPGDPGDVPVTAVSVETWSSVKARYRDATR